MIIIGIDPHASHAYRDRGGLEHQYRFSARSASTPRSPSYKRMLRWAETWPKSRWAIENADGLGHHLAQ